MEAPPENSSLVDEATPEPEQGAAEVLVVDDEAANVEAVRVCLEDLDVEIISAFTGEEALRVTLQREIAVILLDVRLPGASGYEVAKLLRQRARSRHIPIIFMTALSPDAEGVRQAYELGAADYLFKPFAREALRAKVQTFVDLRARTAEVRAQTRQVRILEREAGERRLAQARREWENETLRAEVETQREIAARLEAADRRKDEFLAVLAHELRNPLAPVVAGIELMRLEVGDVPRLAKVCDVMSRQTGHLVSLIDDLLDVSRISRGKVELRREPVDLRACVGQAIEASATESAAAEHEVQVRLGDEPLICDADPVRLTQIASNLLANAVRYTDRGGRIEVETTADAADVVLRVRDNGLGIPPEMLERIFDTFVQERIGDSGLGLGLTLVKEVVGLHGGSVEARSEGRGRGSEFEVRLPRLGGASVVAAVEPTSRGDHSDAPLTVLLVEDQSDVAETTRELLEAWGHEVHLADSGRVAIALLESVAPDVVLLDIGLPDMDGFVVAEAIRKAHPAGTPRLVALTGFGQDRDRERAVEAGFDALIVKPAFGDALRHALRPRTHARSDAG